VVDSTKWTALPRERKRALGICRGTSLPGSQQGAEAIRRRTAGSFETALAAYALAALMRERMNGRQIENTDMMTNAMQIGLLTKMIGLALEIVIA